MAAGGRGGAGGNAFLAVTAEDAALNQYWYSAPTLAAMVAELGALRASRIAFLSTPSVFFSFLAAAGASAEERASRAAGRHGLFDLDAQWADTPGFVRWDFMDPTAGFADAGLLGAFDAVVIDPPFITPEVWEQYAVAARALCTPPPAPAGAGAPGAAAGAGRDGGAAPAAGGAGGAGGADSAAPGAFAGRVLASTIVENDKLMARLFGATPVPFQPSIPNLVYQYNFYTNFPPTALAARNPEIPE